MANAQPFAGVDIGRDRIVDFPNEFLLNQTTPCACIASAILRKPATFAPKT